MTVSEPINLNSKVSPATFMSMGNIQKVRLEEKKKFKKKKKN